MEKAKSGVPNVAPLSTCKSRYERLTEDRENFLRRARECAKLTLPTLIPPSGHSKSTVYYTPWQGIGARGVNNLASKLLLSLFPPNSPFFRLIVDDFTLAELTGKPDMRAEIESKLNQIERAVQSEVEGTGLRAPLFSSLKHLIVGGNVCVYLPADGGIKLYKMDSYVVRRDPLGNLLEIITEDEVHPDTLSPEARSLLDETPAQADEAQREESVKVYTRLHRKQNRWSLYQELNGKLIPGSEGSWPLDKAPMLALRWTAVDGEAYGRSYVEEYLGDLISLEGLSKAIVEASAIAAKVIYLLNPNGVTRIRDLTQAESGDVIVGKEDDVSALQSEKQADMRIAYESAKTISDRLSMAFMLHSGVQRQAERVTAEEVRFMASELEDSLGGVYSVLSQEFQLPLVNRLMDRMTKQKRLPALPKQVVKPAIVTGLEALGRGHDLNKLDMFMKAISILGPDLLKQYLNPGDYISRVATALAIDSKGLVRSKDEIEQAEQMQQQQMQMQMMQDMAGKLGPQAIKSMSDQTMQNNEMQNAAPPQGNQ